MTGWADTGICRQLGIDHPIVSAGMGYVARAELAAAVSNAGGLGVIGGGGFTPERLRDEIRLCRSLTDKPFGVDLLLPTQMIGSAPSKPVGPSGIQGLEGEFTVTSSGFLGRPEDLVDVVCEERPAVFASGLGSPGVFMQSFQDAGITVMAVIGNVRHARRVVDDGVDIVVAQGADGGGHTGRVGTMSLIPAVVDAVGDVPVLAAGGIADGRGLAAALALGAQGAWIGSRFIATAEAYGHANYKQCIVEAGEDSTVVTRSYSGRPMRTIRNEWTKDWESRPQDILPFPMQFKQSSEVYAVARRDGDTARGSMPCGQGISMVDRLLPAGEVVHEIAQDALAVLERIDAARR